jgi:hypothetical protein
MAIIIYMDDVRQQTTCLRYGSRCDDEKKSFTITEDAGQDNLRTTPISKEYVIMEQSAMNSKILLYVFGDTGKHLLNSRSEFFHYAVPRLMFKLGDKNFKKHD